MVRPKPASLCCTWQDCAEQGWARGLLPALRIKHEIHTPNWRWISKICTMCNNWHAPHKTAARPVFLLPCFKVTISFSHLCQRTLGSVSGVFFSGFSRLQRHNALNKSLRGHYDMREKPLFCKEVKSNSIQWFSLCGSFRVWILTTSYRIGRRLGVFPETFVVSIPLRQVLCARPSLCAFWRSMS